MTAARPDGDPSGLECTCWRIPDALGEPVPVAWLLLQTSVIVRIKDVHADGYSAYFLEGRPLGACWLEATGGQERHLLLVDVGAGGRSVAVPESVILFAETSMFGLNPGSAVWEPVAHAISGNVRWGSALGGEPLGPLPVTALFQGSGRDFVEVCVRRGRHTCVPGPPLNSQGS